MSYLNPLHFKNTLSLSLNMFNNKHFFLAALKSLLLTLIKDFFMCIIHTSLYSLLSGYGHYLLFQMSLSKFIAYIQLKYPFSLLLMNTDFELKN